VNGDEVAVVALVLLRGVVDDEDVLERIAPRADLLQVFDEVPIAGLGVVPHGAPRPSPHELEPMPCAEGRGDDHGRVVRGRGRAHGEVEVRCGVGEELGEVRAEIDAVGADGERFGARERCLGVVRRAG
jgi:hypothetical protein